MRESDGGATPYEDASGAEPSRQQQTNERTIKGKRQQKWKIGDIKVL